MDIEWRRDKMYPSCWDVYADDIYEGYIIRDTDTRGMVFVHIADSWCKTEFEGLGVIAVKRVVESLIRLEG